jgi:GMP synthase-like glutamine amidotransferase
MIYLVDNTLNGDGASPREIEAALKHVRPALEVHIEPFHKVSRHRVDELLATHIVLSGQSHPWTAYTAESLEGVFDVIRHASRPILGICGGHQQIALAYGARVDLVERLTPGEGYDGARRIRGFFDVQTDSKGLFEGLPYRVSVWHSHCDEVKEVPHGFTRTGASPVAPIEAIEHTSRPVFGVQFHPELFDDEHLHGQQILENFLNAVWERGLSAGSPACGRGYPCGAPPHGPRSGWGAHVRKRATARYMAALKKQMPRN